MKLSVGSGRVTTIASDKGLAEHQLIVGCNSLPSAEKDFALTGDEGQKYAPRAAHLPASPRPFARQLNSCESDPRSETTLGGRIRWRCVPGIGAESTKGTGCIRREACCSPGKNRPESWFAPDRRR